MKRKILIAALLLFSTVNLFAQRSEIFVKAGSAINGYDAVAYFKEAKPVKGQDAFSYKWKASNWLFTSQQNLDSFKLDPEKFAPQFGGYCAYGMSEAYKAPTDPTAFTIVENKLYLNYNSRVKEIWSKDMPKRIEDANGHWEKIKDKE